MKNICERVYKSVALLEGKVAVAVSGGADSMCLLSILCAMPDKKFEVSVINVEHGIRGEESIADSDFVRDYANKTGVEYRQVNVDVPTFSIENKISYETAGRILRYRVFEEALADGYADYICLAHHLDDLCETVMMRIFRGTGLDGLKGIQSRDRFVRPLLDCTRKEIEEYVAEHDIPFRQDQTNFESDYTRNYLRNVVLPAVETKWADYRESILKLSNRAKENEEFLTKIAPRYVVDGKSVYLKIDELLTVDKVLQKHAVRHAVKSLNGGVDFEEKNLEDVLSFLSARNGARLDLADNVKVWKEYDKLVFEIGFESELISYPFGKGVFDFADEKWIIRERTDETVRFDPKKIPENAVIRPRKDGDRFTKFGGKRMSLGDFYTEKKVPKRLRDRYPVIAVDNIVLVTPVEISDSVRVDDEHTTAYVLKKYE